MRDVAFVYDDRGLYVPDEGTRKAGGWVVRDEGWGEIEGEGEGWEKGEGEGKFERAGEGMLEGEGMLDGEVLNGEMGAGAIDKIVGVDA